MSEHLHLHSYREEGQSDNMSMYYRHNSAHTSNRRPNQFQKKGNTRYKTELCRAFAEKGFCKYAEKCQFAHGEAELRLVPRHPKYKTQLCRTFHTTSYCPYGQRCHFIHDPERISPELRKRALSANMLSPEDRAISAAGRAMSQPTTPLGHGSFSFPPTTDVSDSGTFSDSEGSSPSPLSPSHSDPSSRTGSFTGQRPVLGRSLTVPENVPGAFHGAAGHPPPLFEAGNVMPGLPVLRPDSTYALQPSAPEFVPSGAISADPTTSSKRFVFDHHPLLDQLREAPESAPSAPGHGPPPGDGFGPPSWLATSTNSDTRTTQGSQSQQEQVDPVDSLSEALVAHSISNVLDDDQPPSPSRRLPVFATLSSAKQETTAQVW